MPIYAMAIRYVYVCMYLAIIFLHRNVLSNAGSRIELQLRGARRLTLESVPRKSRAEIYGTISNISTIVLLQATVGPPFTGLFRGVDY